MAFPMHKMPVEMRLKIVMVSMMKMDVLTKTMTVMAWPMLKMPVRTKRVPHRVMDARGRGPAETPAEAVDADVMTGGPRAQGDPQPIPESASSHKSVTSQASGPAVMEDLAKMISFPKEKSQCTPKSYSALKAIIERVKARPGSDILVVQGHAYMLSTQKWNVTLSARRAEMVHDYLVTRGLPEDRVVFVGMGDRGPTSERIYTADGHITFAFVTPEASPYLVEGVGVDGDDSLRLTFELTRSISSDDVSVSTDGRQVFMVRMDGAQVEREWLPLQDSAIKRALYTRPRMHRPQLFCGFAPVQRCRWILKRRHRLRWMAGPFA